MSIRDWFEERKQRQTDRDELEYGVDAGDEEAWEDEDEPEPEPGADQDVTAEPVAAEPVEAEPEAAEPEAPEPEAERDTLIPKDSWWKRRLLGGLPAAPDPAAEVEPEPEILPDEAEAVTEPEPEPQPEPAQVEAAEPSPELEELEAYEEPEPEEAAAYEEPEPHYDLGPLDDEELLAEEEIEIDSSGEEAVPPVGTDVPGPRRARLEGERRRRRRRELRGGILAAAVAAVVGLVGTVVILSRDQAPPPGGGVTAQGPGKADTITTTLLFGTKEQRPDAGPTWMTLLSYDSATGKGAVIYLPAHTATGVPGRGLLPVEDAYATGGVPLLLLATETLLGTPVDRYVELSDADAEILFREIGPLTVEVPQDVRVSAGPGQARLIFGAGPQRLSPELLAGLLYVKGLEGDDVELGARHLAFWSSLFEAFSFDADGLGAAVKGSGAALGESDASLDEIAELFELLAEAEATDRALALLPVRQVGVGGSELYQVDQEEVDDFLRETIGEQAVSGKEVRVQILNGNGAPGIGQYVAERLGGEGFRVILSGNARRLNYRETLVITYDRSSKGLGLAERTRDLIGVGEVQVGAQSQGIVDLTIVVGKDFLETL